MRCKELEKENSELKQRLSLMEGLSTSGVSDSRFVESAELINVSQPQKHEPVSPVLRSKIPLIYWLAIMNLMQSWSSFTTVLNNCSKQTSIQQNSQIPSQLIGTTKTMSCSNWSPSKTWSNSHRLWTQVVDSNPNNLLIMILSAKLWVPLLVTAIQAMNRRIHRKSLFITKWMTKSMTFIGNKRFQNYFQILFKISLLLLSLIICFFINKLFLCK